jgi:hypothetical protein
MRGDARPRFDPERFLFFRRELAGYASAISPGDPSKALKVLNPTTMEIADLCTGYATVDEIKRHVAARYQNDPTGVVGGQVDEALLMLRLYDLVTVEPEAPPPPVAQGAELELRRLLEWDLIALRVFLSGGAFPEKAHPPLVHYRHPYVTVDAYSELLIRMRLFHQKEQFYALCRGADIEFILSVFDERPLKPNGAIALIAGVESIPAVDGVARVFPYAERDLTGRLAKLQWRHVTGGICDPALEAAFEQIGFRLEATLPDEFGPGRDEKIWGRVLRPGDGIAPGPGIAGGDHGCDTP